MRRLLGNITALDLPATIIFDYPTIDSLISYLHQRLTIEHTAKLEQARALADAASIVLSEPSAVVVKELVVVDHPIPAPNEQVALVINSNAPKLTKAGYFTVPSIRRLRTMTNEQLRNVPRFVIGRYGVGEVAFLYPVDLLGADLDAIVHISRGSVTVYPSSTRKPSPGYGLNQPSLITLKGIIPRGQKDYKSILAFKGKLLQACARMGGVFVHYDPDQGIWILKTECF